MDQDAAVEAIRALIDVNSASLVAGLVQNDVERQIAHLSGTLLSNPPDYYAIVIDVEEARERDYAGVQNQGALTGSPYVSEYRMAIAIGDKVLYNPGDAFFGRTAHTNFRKLCDRVVKLFRRDTVWIPSQTSTPRFRLPQNNRDVVVRNYEPSPEDVSLLLFAEIVFTMYGCDD